MSTEIREQESLELWGRYDELAAELVKARRAFREGRATRLDTIRLRTRLSDVQLELLFLDQVAAPPED
jgi:hypothetical protein